MIPGHQIYLTLRLSFFLLASLACTPLLAGPVGPVTHEKGLLWEISKPGVAPSYLFGTMHSSDPRVTALPVPLERSFDRSGSFSMELIFTGAGIVHMAEIMFFGEGETLEQAIGPELYQETKDALKQAGLPTRDLNKKKPWAIIMSLGAPRKTNGAIFLDLLLQRKAVLQFKPTYGLETMDEQLEVFNGLPMEDQIQLLNEALKFQSQSAIQMKQLLNAYLERDLAKLAAISDRYQNQAGPAYDKLMDRLLAKRNQRMAERMQPRLQEGNAFIAVGALHLPGENGLLTLLEKQGYRVAPLY
jgi:uncharacterized protein YbaP (TraB family)